MSLKKLVTSILLAFVGVMFIVNVTPMIESQVNSANITNALTKALIDMAAWVLPVGGIIATFYGVFKLFQGKGSSD